MDMSETELSPEYWEPVKTKTTDEHHTKQMEKDQKIPESEDEILDAGLWDRFHWIPRDKQLKLGGMRPVFRVLKILVYFILFCLVLGTAVMSKICLLLMTTSITKDSESQNQTLIEKQLLISMCIPYGLWFVSNSTKRSSWPSCSMLCFVLVIEMFHTFGLCLFVFRVLPRVDIIRAFIVLGSIFTVPATLNAIFDCVDKSRGRFKRIAYPILRISVAVTQLGSIIACCTFGILMTKEEKQSLRVQIAGTISQETISRPEVTNQPRWFWELPVSLICISMAYWENFADRDISIFGLTVEMNRWKILLNRCRPKLYLFASVWKICLAIGFAKSLNSEFLNEMPFSAPTDTSSTAPSTVLHENISIIRQKRDIASGESESEHFDIYGILYLHIFSVILLTGCARIACKLSMQRYGFSLPLTLATPFSATILALHCVYQYLPTAGCVCVCPDVDGELWLWHFLWLIPLWLSKVYLLSHIWFPAQHKMDTTDRLFVRPLRCGIFTEESLLLRRRRQQPKNSSFFEDETGSIDNDDDNRRQADDTVPHIFACATMWHETRTEMTQLLASLFRMDIDHSARFLAQKYYKIRDPDYYKFEAHIFFDDAIELSDDNNLVPNTFVSDLMDSMDDALSCVHERRLSLGPPIRSPTPYGGRLTWRLPGGTKLVTHLKDKHKARQNKRWSQVMYFYYLLGYRILAQPDPKPDPMLKPDPFQNDDLVSQLDSLKLTDGRLRRRRRRKTQRFSKSAIFESLPDDIYAQAENTYILTLDGDVEFYPNAVRLLVHKLKTNKKVGAACGRVHPVGSGPILWYQTFEYAIGHWLQKTSEHVFGCVLCVPGCFGLIRGSSLMDNNVARTYATKATEASHCIQYDMCEDRWLSTLLLQQGYKIEYCATSDAFTHAPETFAEFFNQRRRWGVSTLANTLDLLGGWKLLVKINDNINTLFVVYQFAMLVSTILGPATILLMIASTYTVVFKTTVVQSHILAIAPAIAFILICFYARPSTQRAIASVMSAMYAIVMTIVIIGTIAQAFESDMTHPNIIFFLMLTLVYFISAVLHPAEFSCVVTGVLYLICLPTGYLILTIYCLCNMHIVSWGTREASPRETKSDIENELREKARQRKRKWGLDLNMFYQGLVDMFKQAKQTETQLLKELINEIRSSRQPPNETQTSASVTGNSQHIPNYHTGVNFHQIDDAASISVNEAPKGDNQDVRKYEDPDDPDWLISPITGYGPICPLSRREKTFWKQLIQKYLNPIKEDKTHEAKLGKDLKELRNNIVFAFFMASAIWIAFSMELQSLRSELEDKVFLSLPTLTSSKYMTLEPLSLIFLAFFAAILVVQFCGMFKHRWDGFLHMLTITEVSCGKTTSENDKVRETISKVKQMQRLSTNGEETELDYDADRLGYDSIINGEADALNDLEAELMNKMDDYEAATKSDSSDKPHLYDSSADQPRGKGRRSSHKLFDTDVGVGRSVLAKMFAKRYREDISPSQATTLDMSDLYTISDKAKGFYNV